MANIKKKKLTNRLLLGLFLLPLTAAALDNDQQQPLHIKADHATLNYKSGISIYQGHVQLTQGTTVLNSDTLITHSNKKHQTKKIIAIGHPASYQTIVDPTKPLLILIGHTINYYPQRGWAEAIGEAKATQGDDSFASPQINYDVKVKMLISPLSQQGHTKIVFNSNQKP